MTRVERAFQGLWLMAVVCSVSFIDIPATTFSSITEENPTTNALAPQHRNSDLQAQLRFPYLDLLHILSPDSMLLAKGISIHR